MSIVLGSILAFGFLASDGALAWRIREENVSITVQAGDMIRTTTMEL